MSEFGPSPEEARGISLAQQIVALEQRATSDADYDVIVKKYDELEELFDSTQSRERGLEGTLAERLREAEQILGTNNVLGPATIEKCFGIRLNSEDIPPLNFTKEALKRAETLGQFLVLRVDKAPDGQPLTMQKLDALMAAPTSPTIKQAKVLYAVDWYGGEPFYATETPRLGWALTGKTVLEGSLSKNYLEQTRLAKQRLETLFQGNVPPEYQQAFQEFDEYVSRRFPGKSAAEIQTLLQGGECATYSQELADLKLTHRIRRRPVEAIYDAELYFQANDEYLLPGEYDWTNCRRSDGSLVIVGNFDATGVIVRRRYPGNPHAYLGLVLSLQSLGS